MSKPLKQVLPSRKAKLASDEDINVKIDLLSTSKELDEYNITNFLDLSEQLDKERDESTKYRINGSIDFVSFTRNKETTWNTFNKIYGEIDDGLKFRDEFDVYIVYPYELQQLSGELFIKNYRKLTKITDYQEVKLPLSNNIFNENNEQFVFNAIVDIKDLTLTANTIDLSLPMTDLYLYLEYKGDKASSLKRRDFKSLYPQTIQIDSNSELGYSDDFDDTAFELAIIGAIKPSTYFDTEFISTFKTSILYFFEINDMKVTSNNVILNAEYIKYYLSFNNSWFDYVSEPLTGNTIYGDLIKFEGDEFLLTNIEDQENQITYPVTILDGEDARTTETMDDFLVDLENYMRFHVSTNFRIRTIKTEKSGNFYIIEVQFFNNATSNEYSNVTLGGGQPEYIGKTLQEISNTFINLYNGNNQTSNGVPLSANEVRNDSIKYRTFYRPNFCSFITKGGEPFFRISFRLSTSSFDMKFNFNPLVPIKIREFSSFVETGNPIDTEGIPDYAFSPNADDNFVWRDLLSVGFIEPESNNGVDYPFINDVHYPHQANIVSMKPFINDRLTRRLFQPFDKRFNVDDYENDDNLNDLGICI